MAKRWLRKRETIAYFLVLRYAKKKGEKCIDLGEVVDILKPFMGSKRLADEMARRLIRLGLAERPRHLKLCPKPLDEFFEDLAASYIAGRMRRRGIEASADPVSRTISVEERECTETEKLAELIGYKVECVSSYSSS